MIKNLTRLTFVVAWSVLGLFLFVNEIQAQDAKISEPVLIEVFERKDCQHCQAERIFLEELQQERDDFIVNFRDITEPEHQGIFEQLTSLQNLPKATPVTLIGATVLQGFDTPQTTGVRIEQLIDYYQGKTTYTAEEFIAEGGSENIESAGSTCDDGTACAIENPNLPFLVNIPFIGATDVSSYSLPAMSAILGFIDGFNPCAMWVLVTFLIVLLQLGSRKKMWQFAGVFILAEAVMYYLILNVWFTTWDFVGLDRIITPIVGLLAIGGGIFFLYEWKTNDGTCKVGDLEQKARISNRIQKLASSKFTIFTLLGILGLALSVNVIEFACSIGIPQAFTKIIEMNNVGFMTSQFYMLLYILFYMIDDLIVFGIALYGADKLGLTTKYSRWSNLIGGILMILLGSLLIFRPEWLMF